MMKVRLLQNQNVPVSYPVWGSYTLLLPVFHAIELLISSFTYATTLEFWP